VNQAGNRTIHRFSEVPQNRRRLDVVLVGDRLGIAQGLRASLTVGVRADLGPMETPQRVPSVPFNLSRFEKRPNDAFRHVVENDRLPLAAGKDVADNPPSDCRFWGL